MREPKPVSTADFELAKLVALAQRGDEGALAALIEASQDRLIRFCIYLHGNEERGRDLCQETFIHALENLASLKNPGSFTSWLLRMAKNLFLNQIKGPRGSETLPLEEIDSLPELAEVTDQDLILHVRGALERLDPQSRVLLLLVDLEENSYSEAAEIMGISESDVRNRLHRIRRIFMKKIA